MHTSMTMTVNSPPLPHRDITGTSTASYRSYNDDYPSVQRQVDIPIQPEIGVERTKKDKKWSIGKLFRRKKKEEDSGSSSQSEDDVSSRSPKRKTKKKKRVPAVNNFDHIVIRDSRRAQSLAKSNLRDTTDDGVLSDPSAGFINYRAKTQDMCGMSKESLILKDDHTNTMVRVANETPSKKTRKGRLKARVEALRNSMKGESSSDEESLKSSNSSSMIRFRSEDSLMRSRDSSLNKKSRNARNERYIKRLSRDEENQLNKEAELLQQGYTKAEIEMLTRTPTSQSSGYGTCKREPSNIAIPEPTVAQEPNRLPMKSESVSSFPSTQSYPSSINFNAKVNNEHINYSVKYPNNVKSTRDSLSSSSHRERTASNNYDNQETVMYVKFPLGNVTNVKKDERAPPVPPPRDMHRKVTTPLSMYYETNPIVADRVTSSSQVITHGVLNNDFERVMRRSQERTMNYGLRRPISNSEDHIAMHNNENMQNIYYRSEQPRRPASVSAEPHHYGLYMNTPPWRKKYEQHSVSKPDPVQLKQDYLYYADQSPRSRRPISIKNGQNCIDKQYLSDSQASSIIPGSVYRRPRNASEFWKKIDNAERQRQQQTAFANSRSNSEYSSNSQIYRNIIDHSKALRGNVSKSENADHQNKNKPIDTQMMDGSKIWKATTEYKRSVTVEPPNITASPASKTHARHKSDTFISSSSQIPSDDEKSSERRKSTNLDDALNELEAIYNSLGLGDEDLLDRAERRELMTPKFNDQFNDWNGNDNEIQLRSQPTTPLRRISRRSTLPDKLQDDMAFRRMNSFSNKDKPNIKEAQAQISYMLASPAYIPYASDDDRHPERNEPDIVYDDVVYRTIKQTNNRLKTIDPQPPFGIPVGPVSPAPQSDYLHATPENKGRSRFVPKRSPDIVSDDLAYRSLRKDNKHVSLFSNEDYTGHINNNHSYHELVHTKDSSENIKKKRAIRSLSANIFTMIQKEIDDALNMSKSPTLQKTHSNSDVMRRLRETYENKETKQDHFPRNKVKHRNNTVNIFVNNSHPAIHHFAKDDSFIHSDDKCFAKSSSCDKSKNSSPSHKSSQTSKRSSKDEFQHVLSMLAQEAMDTSNKLGVALAELDKNRNSSDNTTDIQNRLSESRMSFLNELTNKSFETDTEVKHVEKHVFTGNCNEEQLDEKSIDITDKTKAEKTEDSLFTISDQLHKVEDQLKYSFEKDLKFSDEILRLSSNADHPSQAQETIVIISDKECADIIPNTIQNNDTEIGNLTENYNKPEIIVPLSESNSLNPFLNSTNKMKELDEIKAFKELKDGISDLIAGISEVNEKLFMSKLTKNEDNKMSGFSGISETNQKLNQVPQNNSKEISTDKYSSNLSIYEDDLNVTKDAADSTEYNSSEELATIFKLDSNIQSTATLTEPNNEIEKPRNDLSSPKLVKTMNQQLRRFSVDEGDTSRTKSLPSKVVPWRVKKLSNSSEKEERGEH